VFRWIRTGLGTPVVPKPLIFMYSCGSKKSAEDQACTMAHLLRSHLLGMSCLSLCCQHNEMQMDTHHSSTLSCPSAPVNLRARVWCKALCCWGNVDCPQQGNALPVVTDQLWVPTDVISLRSLICLCFLLWRYSRPTWTRSHAACSG